MTRKNILAGLGMEIALRFSWNFPSGGATAHDSESANQFLNSRFK